MQVIVKKTTELPDDEIIQINILFKEIMAHERDIKIFKDNYLNTPFGYSYHSMLFTDDGKIVGFHSCIPFYYLKDGERFIAALGIDSMVAKEYRDYFHFRDMFMATQDVLKEAGCKLRIGFPNDNSYQVLKKGFKYKDIGSLRTYILPIKIGSIRPLLSWLNPLSTLLANCLVGLSFLSKGNNERSFTYQKEETTFNMIRYKWYGGDYEVVENGKLRYVYKNIVYEGVNGSFLLDYFPKTRTNFEKSIRDIYKREKKHAAVILYIGDLNFNPLSMIAIPKKIEPKHFNFTCLILQDKEFFDEGIYNIRNWDVNLSNYDLL